MNLPRFAITHPSVVVMAALLTSAWGVVAFLTAPRSEDPEFAIRTCTIATCWPGATAEKVEQLITDPIETIVDTLDEVDKVRSTTTVGQSVVFVDLEDDTEDVDAVWDKLRAKVVQVRAELPQGADAPFVNTDFADTAAMLLAVYQVPPPGRSDIIRAYTPREMEIIAERLQDELELLPAVARVDLFGVQDEVIYLETDAGSWSQLHLTSGDLRGLLQARNIVAPGGSIDTIEGRYGVRIGGELLEASEIDGIVVGAHGDRAPVLLRDLGLSVNRDYLDPPRRITRLRTRDMNKSAPCVIVSFTMKKGGKMTDLGDDARALIARAEQTFLPGDIKVAVVSDQPRQVQQSISVFLRNLAQAVTLVILVAYALIGFRIAVVMAAAIPMTMLTAIGISRMFGVQIETISIASLIIALGMLVDCAVEVCDNVHRFQREGHRRFDATVKGAQQVAVPVLMGVLTSAFAFLPMLTLPGAQGEFLYSLPVVVSTTLLSSWVLAFSMIALMAYAFVRPSRHAAPLARALGLLGKLRRRRGEASAKRNQAESSLARVYDRLVRPAIRFRLITLGGTVGLFILAVSLVVTGRIPTQYFPDTRRDQFVVDIFLPEGRPIGATDRVAEQVERLLLELDYGRSSAVEHAHRLDNLVTFVGEGSPRFFLSLEPEQPAGNYAMILVNTTSPDVVDEYMADLREAAFCKVPGARVVPRKLSKGPPVKAPVAIRVVGEDPPILRAIAGQVEAALRETGKAWDVHDSWGSFGYQVFVDPDESQAKLSGVTQASIAQTTNAYFSGHYLTTFREGDHQIPVYLRLPAEQRSIEGVGALYVEGQFGKVPLDSVASVRKEWVPAKIERYKKQRCVEVRARATDRVLPNAVLREARPAIQGIAATLPPGYRIEIGGEQAETTDSQTDIGRAFGIAALLIVMCLVVQFNSVVKPLLVLSTVPIGVTWADVRSLRHGYAVRLHGEPGDAVVGRGRNQRRDCPYRVRADS